MFTLGVCTTENHAAVIYYYMWLQYYTIISQCDVSLIPRPHPCERVWWFSFVGWVMYYLGEQTYILIGQNRSAGNSQSQPLTELWSDWNLQIPFPDQRIIALFTRSFSLAVGGVWASKLCVHCLLFEGEGIKVLRSAGTCGPMEVRV